MPRMARLARIFTPLFVYLLVLLAGGSVVLAYLRFSVLACTVGFNTPNQTLTATEAAQCVSYDVGSAVLIAVCLAAGAGLIWLGARFFTRSPHGLPANAVGRMERGPIDSVSLPRTATGPFARAPYRWVFLMAGIFFVVSFVAASWQYVHFIAGTWDLSVNQQALSSASLGGKPYPFYESFNCGTHGQCSFLQVHTAFFAYPVSAMYGVAPTAFTLFAIQSLAVGLAAVPLYALSFDVTRSRRLSLVVAAAFLAWVPLFLAVFSFHWEAFIPVEVFTIFWLWNRHRYLIAIPVILLSFVTIEVTPVLIFFVGLFFLWPWLVKALQLFYHAAKGGRTRPAGSPSKLRLWRRCIWTCLQVPEVYASLGLMVCSLAAYVLLRLFVTQGGWLLGLPPVPAAYALPLGSPNKAVTFAFASISGTWQAKLLFWIVVYLTLGFIPLLAPRTLILVLPWFVFTAFSTYSAFWRFGDQYPFIPAAALFIGFAYGLDWLYRRVSARLARLGAARTTPDGPPADSPNGSPVSSAFRRRRWTLDGTDNPSSAKAARVISFGVVIIIGGNLLLNPIDPLASSLDSAFGKTFIYTHPAPVGAIPDNGPLQQLVSLIPPDAVVTAPLPVYSWVADDPYAYPMIKGFNVSLLPVTVTGLADYVLLPYDTPIGVLNATLLSVLYDHSDFGVRGCVASSAVGGVELLEGNYTGAPETFGAVGALCPDYFAGGTGLNAGPSALVLANTSSPSGVVVRSTPCASNQTLWTGPNVSLPPGEYRLRIVVGAFNSTGSTCGGQVVKPTYPLLALKVTGRAGTGSPSTSVLRHNFRLNVLCSPACGGWYYWNSTIITLGPATSDLSVSGLVLIGQYYVQIASLILSPVR